MRLNHYSIGFSHLNLMITTYLHPHQTPPAQFSPSLDFSTTPSPPLSTPLYHCHHQRPIVPPPPLPPEFPSTATLHITTHLQTPPTTRRFTTITTHLSSHSSENTQNEPHSHKIITKAPMHSEKNCPYRTHNLRNLADKEKKRTRTSHRSKAQ